MDPMQKTFDRAAEDLGNSVHLEHVNVAIPDQRLAQLFYAAGLGLTRDPYLQVMDDNMWMNAGRSQFHLPTGKAQVLRGKTGIVIEGREALLNRLKTVQPKLADTKFGFAEHNDYVEATCPWGNRVRLHEPDATRFGRIVLGIPYVEFDVPVGTAKGIAKFYEQMIGTPATVVIGGIMEHIEEAGVHSGDSSCALPAHSLPAATLDVIRTQIDQLARALKVVGLMNAQFAVQGEQVFLLEVNPRASRTSPFVSKAIGRPSGQ